MIQNDIGRHSYKGIGWVLPTVDGYLIYDQTKGKMPPVQLYLASKSAKTCTKNANLLKQSKWFAVMSVICD